MRSRVSAFCATGSAKPRRANRCIRVLGSSPKILSMARGAGWISFEICSLAGASLAQQALAKTCARPDVIFDQRCVLNECTLALNYPELAFNRQSANGTAYRMAAYAEFAAKFQLDRQAAARQGSSPRAIRAARSSRMSLQFFRPISPPQSFERIQGAKFL